MGQIALFRCLALSVCWAAMPATSAQAADQRGGTAGAHTELDTVDSGADAAVEETFSVTEIRVLGNTVLPTVSIEKAIYPYLGPGRSLADIERARVALEAAYKEAGYGAVFVDIPEQDVVDGLVRLQVTQGRVDRVRVVGARYFSNGAIRRGLPALERGNVLELPALQGQLEALNRQTRDRQITPVLRAGRSPGTVDVELKVKDEVPVHASLEVNNRYTANTSETRASATLSYDNLWQRHHSLSLQYQTAPEEPDEATVLAATYVMPLQSTGHTLALYVVDTNSEFETLGGDFAALGVLGEGRIYGARYVIPLRSSDRYFHSFNFGADYKAFDEIITQEDGTEAPTPISYINWSLTYGASLRTPSTLSSFDLGANFGVRGLANDSYEFYFKRSPGKPNKGEPGYFYLRGSAQHERPAFWGTRLYLRLAGQFTPQALVSNEQFSIGGADTVRGYLESESLGDYGAGGALEWRLPLSQGPLARLQQFHVFTFYDAGVVALQHPLPEQIARTTLSSWGAGLRLAAFGLEAALDWAYPLRSSDDTDRGDSRVHFRLHYGF